MGDSIKVAWQTFYADEVELAPPGAAVAASGERFHRVGPGEGAGQRRQESHTLTAANSHTGVSATDVKTVTVLRPARSDRTINRVARAPSGAPLGAWMDAEVGGREVLYQCGHYLETRRLNLTDMTGTDVQVRFEGLDGTVKEVIVPGGRRHTDEFGGLDPRGTWKLRDLGRPDMRQFSFNVVAHHVPPETDG